MSRVHEPTRPPAWAWDWFSRQRLTWRTARDRLAAADAPAADRYRRLLDKPDVLPALREDYPTDAVVRDVVDGVVAELVFLGRTDGAFEDLGARNAPRGMRWWWEAITGREAQAPTRPEPPARQLALDAVTRAADEADLDRILTGYGD